MQKNPNEVAEFLGAASGRSVSALGTPVANERDWRRKLFLQGR